jgi:D-alanyl-D-alanine carboxypeptidase (penicillin-binding protein 5/6)
LVRHLDFQVSLDRKIPINKTGLEAPYLTAKSAAVVDLETKTVIYSRNPDWQLMPASTTKIMTALTAFDYFQLNDILTVKEKWILGQVLGLNIGEQLTFSSLLYGMLVGSGNDAAMTIADNFPGGRVSFVKAMNDKAKKINLNQTNFVNPSGIEADGHVTSAHDLAILTAEALSNPIFSQIVATKDYVITDLTKENKYYLKNTNELIGKIPGIKGVKTGWTENSGECLVTFVDREQGKIITVLLGSQDRFGETQKLIDWVYNNFKWEEIIPVGSIQQ